jgi:hypothetical protein
MAKDLLSRIEELRTQPEAVRNRYAFGIALFVTLCIAVVWGIALPTRFSQEGTTQVSAPETSRGVFGSVSASFETIKQSMSGMISSFQNSSNESDLPVPETPFELDFEAMLALPTPEERTQEEIISASTTASSSVSAFDPATTTPSGQ